VAAAGVRAVVAPSRYVAVLRWPACGIRWTGYPSVCGMGCPKTAGSHDTDARGSLHQIETLGYAAPSKLETGHQSVGCL
jgi:hypothetical protein